MIEFKAECGHAVRARDEDAGGTVRCSYCGRNATVPIEGDRDLEFLFSEVQQSPQEDAKARRRRIRDERSTKRKSAPKRDFNPFSIIVRLGYAAALIIVVVVVARKLVIPMFSDETTRARMFSGAGRTPPAPSAAPTGGAMQPTTAPTRPPMLGLVREGRAGLFVASTPPGGSMYGVEESKAPASGRIHQVAGNLQGRTPSSLANVPDGTYMIEVAFAWNDPNLSDPSLPNYKEYTEFRRKIERATAEQRRSLMEEYFVPDEASAAFVDQTADQIYLVRQYRGVVMRGGQGPGVRALFLPRLTAGGTREFRIEPLLNGYIPQGKNYEFDERHVRSELAYYGVVEADQATLLEALGRIGVAPYQTPDRRVRLFKIGITDGRITSRVVREANE